MRNFSTLILLSLAMLLLMASPAFANGDGSSQCDKGDFGCSNHSHGDIIETIIETRTEVIREVRSDFKEERNDLRRGVAAAAALVTLTPSAAGKTVVNLAGAYYSKEGGLGFTANHRLKIWEDEEVLKDTMLLINAGIAYGIHDSGPVAHVGVGFEF